MAVNSLSFGRTYLKQSVGMSCILIWWRAITWEGAVAFEVEAYLPHPAGLQISLWTHPKRVRMFPFLLSFFSWHTVCSDRIWQVGVDRGSFGHDFEWTHPVCFSWHYVNETNRRSLLRSQKKRYLELVPDRCLTQVQNIALSFLLHNVMFLKLINKK